MQIRLLSSRLELEMFQTYNRKDFELCSDRHTDHICAICSLQEWKEYEDDNGLPYNHHIDMYIQHPNKRIICEYCMSRLVGTKKYPIAVIDWIKQGF